MLGVGEWVICFPVAIQQLNNSHKQEYSSLSLLLCPRRVYSCIGHAYYHAKYKATLDLCYI